MSLINILENITNLLSEGVIFGDLTQAEKAEFT